MLDHDSQRPQLTESETTLRVRRIPDTPKGSLWPYRAGSFAFIGLLTLLTACGESFEPDNKVKPTTSSTTAAISIKPTEAATSIPTNRIVVTPSVEPTRPQPRATSKPTLRPIESTPAPTVPAEVRGSKEYQNRLPQLAQVIDMLKMAIKPAYQGPVSQTSSQPVKEQILFRLFGQNGKKDLPVELPEYDANKAPFSQDVESPLEDIFNKEIWERDSSALQKTTYRATYLSDGHLCAFSLNGKINLKEVKEAQSYIRSEVGHGYSIPTNRLKELKQLIFNPLPNTIWEKTDELGVLRIVSISSQGRIDISIHREGWFAYSYMSPEDPRFADEQDEPATPPGKAMAVGLRNLYDLIKPPNRTFSSLKDYMGQIRQAVRNAERADSLTRNPYNHSSLDYEMRRFNPRDILKAASAKQLFPFPSVNTNIDYDLNWLRVRHLGTSLGIMVDLSLLDGAKPYLDKDGNFREGGIIPVLKRGFDIQGIVREYSDDEKGRLWGKTPERINEATLLYDGSKAFLRWALPSQSFSF